MLKTRFQKGSNTVLSAFQSISLLFCMATSSLTFANPIHIKGGIIVIMDDMECTVFENPATDGIVSLTMGSNYSDGTILSVEIKDAQENLVFSQIGGTIESIDLSNLPTGNYTIHVKSDLCESDNRMTIE